MGEQANKSAGRRPKTGLVLEGGGMRGIFTAGVLDILMDHSFRPDTICATSAGATFGINLPSGQKGRVLRYNLRLAGDPRYFSLRSLLQTGNVVNTDFAYRILPEELDKFDYQAYSASGTDFFACVTNIRTGLPEYMKVTDAKEQIDYIRASASLPFLSRKVIIEGEPYLDGGITDNIPLDKCIDEGCERIVVVLTHPKGYLKKGSMYLLSRLLYRRNKALQEAFRLRNQRYNARLEQIESLETEGKIFVIRPSEPLALSRLEKDHSKIQAAYDMGYGVTQALWPSLECYLKQ
ncbi:MAG: patatin family protein [Candidatus Cryptobacteroides sp.]